MRQVKYFYKLKNLMKMKACLIVIFAFLFVNNSGLTQEENAFKDKIIRADSAQSKIPSNIHSSQLDSLKVVWQLEEEKRMAIAREKYLAAFGMLPDSLIDLNMSRLGLIEMPDISRFGKLKNLYANGNKFTKVPKSTFSSDSLRFVDISGNPLKHLKIPKHSSVVSLKMENCGLKKVPFSIRKMKNIKRLYVNNQGVSSVLKNNNNLKKVPRFLKGLEDLSEIDFSFNKIKLNKASVNRLRNIEIISLAGNKLSSIPDKVYLLVAARRINLSKNQLSDLPPSFANLDSLEVLILYDNNFDKIPLEALQLKNLVELDFYYNNIDKIPEEINQLHHLERLFLSYNKINLLPATMQSLKNLRSLYIHHNQLKIIPSWITELSKLEVIHVGYNQLVDFPDVSEIPGLYEVDIQNNTIGTIPWNLVKKENLKLLLMKNNLFLEDEEALLELKKLQQSRINECVISID